MNRYIEVITTFETMEQARKMAGEIIAQKLGACCSIVEIESLYPWKGKIENENEAQLTIKTEATHYDKLEKFILDTHPYETPQIIALPIVNGSKEYIKWLDEQVG